MDLAAVSAHDPHHVLETQRDAGEGVVLGDRQVDDLVRFEGVPVKIPLLDRQCARDGRADELPFLDVVDPKCFLDTILPCEFLDGVLDAAIDIAAPRVVAGAVEDAHRSGARLKAHLGDRHDELRVGVRRLLGGPVPPDVGLEDDHVTPGDERLHPPQECHRLARPLRGAGRRSYAHVDLNPARRGQERRKKCRGGNRSRRASCRLEESPPTERTTTRNHQGMIPVVEGNIHTRGRIFISRALPSNGFPPGR